MNVIALPREKAVWLDLDLDQCVPWFSAAEPRFALASQAQDLTVARAGWDNDVKGGAVGYARLVAPFTAARNSTGSLY